MLGQLTSVEVRRISQLAGAARNARDAMLHGVSGEAVNEPHPAKGEHDRIGAGGFDILPADDRAVAALRGAISGLRPAARSELFALMRIGQGDLAKADFQRGLAEAARLGDESIAGILADDIDLQSHLDRGLYELGAT
ncbi:MAG TPA: DUF3775 domain-containing protein [Caulobacteraceae bacterium]|nr:DUF3775 domain-containing protein [Caulobacteraceae bacterium]